MKITEKEFYDNLLEWLAKAKDEQIIVANTAGKTTIVVGVGDQILPDPEPFEFELDTIHNPWLD